MNEQLLKEYREARLVFSSLIQYGMSIFTMNNDFYLSANNGLAQEVLPIRQGNFSLSKLNFNTKTEVLYFAKLFLFYEINKKKPIFDAVLTATPNLTVERETMLKSCMDSKVVVLSVEGLNNDGTINVIDTVENEKYVICDENIERNLSTPGGKEEANKLFIVATLIQYNNIAFLDNSLILARTIRSRTMIEDMQDNSYNNAQKALYAYTLTK